MRDRRLDLVFNASSRKAGASPKDDEHHDAQAKLPQRGAAPGANAGVLRVGLPGEFDFPTRLSRSPVGRLGEPPARLEMVTSGARTDRSLCEMPNGQCPMDRLVTHGFCSDEGAIGH